MAGCIGGVNGDCGRKIVSKGLCDSHRRAKSKGKDINYDVGTLNQKTIKSCVGGVNGDCGRKAVGQGLCPAHWQSKKAGDTIKYYIGQKPKKEKKIPTELIPEGWAFNLDPFWDKELNGGKDWREFKSKSNVKVSLKFQGNNVIYTYKFIISSINGKNNHGDFTYNSSTLPPHTWSRSKSKAIKGETDLQTLHPKIASEFIELVDKSTSDPAEVLAGSHKKANWRCSKGHEWTASPSSRINQNSGCKWCSLSSTSALSEFPELSNIWSEDNEISPDKVSRGSGKLYKIKCPGTEGKLPPHTYEVSMHKYAKGYRCNICSGRKVVEINSFKSLADPDVVSEFVPTPGFKDMNEVSLKSNQMAHWRCVKGHEWKSSFITRSSGSGCYRCNKGNQSKDLLDIFKSIIPIIPSLPYIDQLMLVEASGISLASANAKPIREALRGDKSWDEAMAELAGDDYEEALESEEEEEEIEMFSDDQEDEDLSGDDILEMMDGEDEPEISLEETGEMLEKSLGPGYLDELGEYFVARLLAERWKKEIDKVDHGV